MSYRTYIYLLQDVSHGSNIFNIGITKKPDERLKWYAKGSKFLALFTCPYNGYLHNILFSKFRSTFLERFDLGPNYFEGNIELGKKEFTDVCTIVNDICINDPPPIFEPKKVSNPRFEEEPLSEYNKPPFVHSKHIHNRQCKIPTPKPSLWTKRDFRTRSVAQNNIVRFSRPM